MPPILILTKMPVMPGLTTDLKAAAMGTYRD
jgi:hypothetical protein